MIDVTKYQPVIQKVLAGLKVHKNQREDMTQECYVALLEKQKHLEHGSEIGQEEAYAVTICRSRVINLYNQESQYQKSGYKTKPKIRFESLSDPRVYHKAYKVPIPDLRPEREVTTWELEDAMLTLPFEEYKIVYSLFFEESTLDKVAADLGLSRDQVWTRKNRGIEMLRKYFGGTNGS